MALFDEIERRNVIGFCSDLLKNKALELRDVDGKLEYTGQMGWDVPWHFVKMGDRCNCGLWNTIIFAHIFKRLPKSITKGKVLVPTGCQGCFKVVVRPQTLKGLFALEQIELDLRRESKCGVEIRKQVFGSYGGYFYNRGLDEGLECYKIVRQVVDDDGFLGPEIRAAEKRLGRELVILKRACTEMEAEAGPSDKWEITDEQIKIEQLINQKMNTDSVNREQVDHGIDYVHECWIRFAYDRGDVTVLEYLSPENPLYPPQVTYHHLVTEKQPEAKPETSEGAENA